MGVDVRAHLDFFYFNDLLLLARFGRLLLGLVFQLAQIEDLAYRRFDVRRNLHEIKTVRFRHGKRLVGRYDTLVVTIGIDQLDTGNSDFFVGTWAVFGRAFRLERSANGRILLIVYNTGSICHQRRLNAIADLVKGKVLSMVFQKNHH
jgi:hypothetical protein